MYSVRNILNSVQTTVVMSLSDCIPGSSVGNDSLCSIIVP